MAGEVQRFAAIVDLHTLGIDLKQRHARLHQRPRCHALENRPDPGRHLAGAEGFDHVIVGTDLQTHHPVYLAIPCCQKDDRNVAETSEIFTCLESADIRQPHIEDDQVRRGAFLVLEGRRAKAQPRGVETLLAGQTPAYRRWRLRLRQSGYEAWLASLAVKLPERCRKPWGESIRKSAVRLIRRKPPRRVHCRAEFT